jgi:hypothetical protein
MYVLLASVKAEFKLRRCARDWINIPINNDKAKRLQFIFRCKMMLWMHPFYTGTSHAQWRLFAP